MSKNTAKHLREGEQSSLNKAIKIFEVHLFKTMTIKDIVAKLERLKIKLNE